MLNFIVKITMVNADFELQKKLYAKFCPKKMDKKNCMLTSALIPSVPPFEAQAQDFNFFVSGILNMKSTWF